MENDLERVYWFTVNDCANMFTDSGVNVETFLGDVLDRVLRSRPESRQAYQLLTMIDKLDQQKEIDNANQIASEVFKA
jgi:hypothetical protein